ncbi:hypothetical protein CCYS_03930 [Corynebacterium cystitidis DSM 20524]|uniref:Putative transport protein n=2 Tax=Corynebacterium cystitidis TaxID=35757 RepID=A0A1H9QK91_9CORY|nr:hypothetical protein CCYS_03930 [Corynebacterium cystitidis DSM 20524]SER60882.1 putative transport protein [Corynebacterium cystitidis DSM 20524]SNV84139.1 transporter protein [Corynebacterium cystitidis]
MGAFIDLDADVLANLQNFGLGIFVYVLGLSAGETFVHGSASNLFSWVQPSSRSSSAE